MIRYRFFHVFERSGFRTTFTGHFCAEVPGDCAEGPTRCAEASRACAQRLASCAERSPSCAEESRGPASPSLRPGASPLIDSPDSRRAGTRRSLYFITYEIENRSNRIKRRFFVNRRNVMHCNTLRASYIYYVSTFVTRT